MWVYVGRHRSHGRAITGLEFGTREDGGVSLVSVGNDRCLVEYNLSDSNQVSQDVDFLGRAIALTLPASVAGCGTTTMIV